MATISLTVPDAIAIRVTTALCNQAGVAVSAANAKAEIIQMVKRTVKAYETAQAGQNAQANAAADVDANIVLS